MKNLVEYYDELYPATQEHRDFFAEAAGRYADPVKMLCIGSGTGALESVLACQGYDVTGLEACPEMLESALRRKKKASGIRFFKMSTTDMEKFLGKKFYNIISCLNDRIIFMYDKGLLVKFFEDCRKLLAEDGTLILQLLNYDYFGSGEKDLPVRESLRVKLVSVLSKSDSGISLLSQALEAGNGRYIPVITDEPVYPVRPAEIESIAKEAGFSDFVFYSGFDKSPFSADSPSLVCEIRMQRSISVF